MRDEGTEGDFRFHIAVAQSWIVPRKRGLHETFSNKHMENLQVPAEDRLMGTVYRTRGRHLRTIVDALTRREDEFRVVIVACLPTLLSARQMNLRLEFQMRRCN